MSARTCADCGHRLDLHTPDGCVALHLDGSLCACPTPTPARPEGETPIGGCAFCGCNSFRNVVCECSCHTPTVRDCSPTHPARERGEAMLAELRRKLLEEPTWPEDVPEVSGAECPDCGWPRVQAQREGYPLQAEVARLTRELAEAREAAGEDVDTARLALDAASAKNARLREAVQALTQDDVDFLLDMVDHDPDPRTAPVEANEALESLASRIDAARRALAGEAAPWPEHNTGGAP